jgi:hypothetical protein
MAQQVFLFHLTITSIMCGVIWAMQLVHYPAFLWIPLEKLGAFERFRARRVWWIILPVLASELLSGAFLAFQTQNSIFILNFFLNLVLWVFTFFVSVPLHKKIDLDPKSIWVQQLIFTNWPRAVLWSFRVALLVGVASRFGL